MASHITVTWQKVNTKAQMIKQMSAFSAAESFKNKPNYSFQYSSDFYSSNACNFYHHILYSFVIYVEKEYFQQ